MQNRKQCSIDGGWKIVWRSTDVASRVWRRSNFRRCFMFWLRAAQNNPALKSAAARRDPPGHTGWLQADTGNCSQSECWTLKPPALGLPDLRPCAIRSWSLVQFRDPFQEDVQNVLYLLSLIHNGQDNPEALCLFENKGWCCSWIKGGFSGGFC